MFPVKIPLTFPLDVLTETPQQSFFAGCCGVDA